MQFIVGKVAVCKHSFCYSNVPTTKTKLKDSLLQQPIGSLVGTLISIGDVNDIFRYTSRIYCNAGVLLGTRECQNLGYRSRYVGFAKP